MRFAALLFLGCFLYCAAASAEDASPPFRIGIEMPMQLPITPQLKEALKDIGINYLHWYVYNGWGKTNSDLPAAEVNKAGLDLADYLGADFGLSGCNFDPPDDSISEAVGHGKANGRFRGVVIDEMEWTRLLMDYSPIRLADTSRCKTIPEAYELALTGFRKAADRFAALGSPLISTHVWPVMHHVAARAGCIVCPKICKEFYSPVSLAIGMGAAKQYGRPLWVDCDMWYWDMVSGHPPEEIKSNLLLAYWLGADLVYLEGCGHNLHPAGKQGIPFTLLNTGMAECAQLTPIGEVLRWFCKDYLPANKRAWSFRDVSPDIAIIRFDDTCHGQRYTGAPDHLFGSTNLHSTPDTEAWFQIWNLLTFGKTGRDGISFFKSYISGHGWDRPPDPRHQMPHYPTWPSYASRPMMADSHRFFVPLKGAVVYDHLVGYDLLKDVPLLFLTGIEVSEATMKAVRRCVAEGATCVAWGPLAFKNGFGDWKSGVQIIPEGKGKFILTDDFCLSRVYAETAHLLGRADEIKYRFGAKSVTLKRVTDNEVSVHLN